MVILLPPVPGPKIRGIDTDLLKVYLYFVVKIVVISSQMVLPCRNVSCWVNQTFFFFSQKRKLRELTSILCSPPDLRPELYNSDPWVEFIDLDIEEQCDRLTDLDTDCLMHRSLSSNCAPLSIGFRDDDSGRASCCDPDLPSDQEVSPFHPLIPNQTFSSETSCTSACEELPQTSSPVQTPAAGESPLATLGREALYTQVSEVKPSGKVLLTPEGQTELEKINGKDEEKDVSGKRKMEEKEFQLMVLNPDQGDYTSELNARKTSSALSTEGAGEPCEISGDLRSSPPTSPTSSSDTTSMSPPNPAPVYTMVEAVDRQNSLLLTPNSIPTPQVIIPKTIPTPNGYLTPDLLGSITP